MQLLNFNLCNFNLIHILISPFRSDCHLKKKIIMRFLLTYLLQVILLFNGALTSPFELTEKYIEEYAGGIKDLENLSHETIFKEETLDETALNEEEATKSKLINFPICISIYC